MYDFDGNGQISREDIRTMLSYVPINTVSSAVSEKEGIFTRCGGGSDTYYDRMKVQKQLVQLFSITLKENPIMTFDDFKAIINKVSSDLYLCLFIMVRDKLPGMRVFSQYKVDYKVNIENSVTITTSTKMVSPKLTTLSPSSLIIKSSPFAKKLMMCKMPEKLLMKKLSLNIDDVPDEILLGDATVKIEQQNDKIEFDGVTRFPNAIVVDKGNEDKKEENKIDLTLSPSQYLNKVEQKVSMAVCTCGKLCEVNKNKCADCIAKTIIKDVKTYLYIKKDGNKLKRYWCKLVEYNILCIKFIRL